MKFYERFFLGFCFVFTFGAVAISAVYCSSQQNKVYAWHPNVETVSKKKEVDKIFNIVNKDGKFVIESLVNKDDVSSIRIPSFIIENNKTYPLDISKEFVESLESKRKQVKTLTIGSNVDLNLLKDKKGKGGYFEQLETLEFENGIKEIPGYLFVTPTLKSIKLPNSIESIGDQTFRNTSIEEIELPNTIQKLHSQSFAYNWKLKKVTFRNVDGKQPSESLFMGSAVFQQAILLENFDFPKTLKNVQFEFTIDDAKFFSFYDCNKLKTINSSNTVKNVFESKSSFKTYIQDKKIDWKIY